MEKQDMQYKPSTFFILFFEFGAGHVPVTEFAKKYFNFDEKQANTTAEENGFPFPVFRAGGQKSPWMVDLNHAADYLEKVKEESEKAYKNFQLNLKYSPEDPKRQEEIEKEYNKLLGLDKT